MFVVFYTVKILYICVFMNCSTSYCLGDTLQIHGMCDVCNILLSHNGYLLIFCITKGLKCHDMYLLQCCLICLYIVLNPERFFLHIYVIPSITLFEASASDRNALPVPHVAHTHTHKCTCTHILAFSSDCPRV